MNFSTTKLLASRPAPLSRPATLLTLSAGVALLLMSAQARSADTTATVSAPVTVAPQPQASTSQPPTPASLPEAAVSTPAPAVASAPPADPRYSASNIKLAFNYMDASRDGLISREEAVGFRGVAKNFDKADTDHDNTLSRTEFERAMNHVQSKPR
jgi:hypothetical protein